MTERTLTPTEINLLTSRAKRLSDQLFDAEPCLSLLLAEYAARIIHEGATPYLIDSLTRFIEQAMGVTA